MTEPVSYDLGDGVATITMDDGKANAMSPVMLAAIDAALDRAESDDAVVVLRGRPGVFSAGYDLGVFQSGDGDAVVGMLRAGGSLVHRLVTFPRPVLAACTGHGIAQGAFTLLACDVRIAAEGAFRYGANESAIGLAVPLYATALCRYRMTAAAFHRALVTGPLVDQSTARDWGILDEIVPEDGFGAAIAEEAARLASLPADAVLANRARALGDVAQRMLAAVDDEFPLPSP